MMRHPPTYPFVFWVCAGQMKKKFGDIGGGLPAQQKRLAGLEEPPKEHPQKPVPQISRKATQQLVAVLSNQKFLAPV